MQEKLKDFKGVLISDFYAAYDSIPCPQQKWLIHLMRDLNDAILEIPFDEELKTSVANFADLLKAVVDTIDRRGLKRHFVIGYRHDVEKGEMDIQAFAKKQPKWRFPKRTSLDKGKNPGTCSVE